MHGGEFPFKGAVLAFFFCFFCVCLAALGHDVITTKLTWDGEISAGPVMMGRCDSPLP